MKLDKINSSSELIIFIDFILEKLYTLENRTSLKTIWYLKYVFTTNYIH